jgi:hypothetical protein
MWEAVLGIAILALRASAQESPNRNVARMARATASSESEDTKPANLIDGDISNTSWAPKDGTLPGDAWVELNWPNPVDFQEIVVRQAGSPNLSRIAFEIRDAAGTWRLLQTLGDSQRLLPRLILAQSSERRTTGLRLSGFSGKVSLAEIEVYAKTHPPVIEVGSDLLNHIIGIVTDGWGTQPFANAPVMLKGSAAGKPWRASVQTDRNGMFAVDMPVGLEGEIAATAQVANGASPQRLVQAGDLAPGLTMADDTVPALNLNGDWLFKPDPEPTFYRTDFPDRNWKTIKVPSHWVMEGFESRNGTGGYRRHMEIPQSFRNRIKLLFDGVYSGAEVWLNGKRVGSHEGGFAPFELDISAAANVGRDNLLAVLVRENTLSSPLGQYEFLRQLSPHWNFP